MSLDKTKKTPAKAATPASATAKTSAKAAPAKTAAKKSAPAKATAPKAPTKKPAAAKATPKKSSSPSSQEMMLARVESVRLSQREEGYFDCFGRAANGFCDQGGCVYHAECLSVSRMIHSL